MTLPYEVEKPLIGSYAVSSEFVREFCERIRTITGTSVRLIVKYSSGHKEQYADEQAFLSSPWLHAHVVNSIEIDSGNYNETCVQLRFSDFLIRTATFRVSGQREACIAIEAEILALTSSIKTYIAPLHSPQFNAIPLGFMIAIFGIAVYERFNDPLKAMLLTSGFVFIIIYLITYLLPKYEIQIGKGKKAAARRQFLAKFAFGFVVVSGLGSIYQDVVVETFKNVVNLH